MLLFSSRSDVGEHHCLNFRRAMTIEIDKKRYTSYAQKLRLVSFDGTTLISLSSNSQACVALAGPMRIGTYIVQDTSEFKYTFPFKIVAFYLCVTFLIDIINGCPGIFFIPYIVIVSPLFD